MLDAVNIADSKLGGLCACAGSSRDGQQTDIEMAQDKFNILSESVEASIAEIDVIKDMTDRLDSIKVELSNTTTELGAISEELGASAEEVAASFAHIFQVLL